MRVCSLICVSLVVHDLKNLIRAEVSHWFPPAPGDFVLHRPLGGVLVEERLLGVLGVLGGAAAARDALALHSGE